MKLLFCMASGETAANINSLNEINPDKVIVAVTDSMQQNGKAPALINEIKNMGKKVESLAIKDEHSLKALNQQYEAWLENHFDDEIIVNITGGTKPMSIAAFTVFGGYGFRCFYQNLNPSQIIWLDDESIVSGIGQKVPLELYLRSYQFNVDKKIKLADISREYKDYADFIHEELSRAGWYEDVSRLISKINAHTSERSIRPGELQRFAFNDEEVEILTDLSKATGLLKVKSAKEISFDSQDRAFLNGGWLEVLVADSLRGADFRDIYQSVEISKSSQRHNTHTRQEIDVMAMRQDKLYIIECKTLNWKTASEASASIYKLSSLSDIGGLNTHAIFVSLYDLPASAKTRAAEMGIRLICGRDDIINLKQKLTS